MISHQFKCLALCVFLAPAVHAAVIFSENFDSIAPTSPGDPAGLNAAGWYFRNTATTGTYWNSGGSTRSYSNGAISGYSLYNGGGSSVNTYLLKQWSPVTLDNVGDALTVTFDAIITNASISGTFNISLLSTSNVVTANTFGNSGQNASPIAGATGYGYLQTASTGGIYGVSESTSATTNTLLGSPAALPTLNDSVVHSYSFSITKVTTGFDIGLSRDGSLVYDFLDTSNTGSLTLSTLKLGAVQSIDIDNVVLSTSMIPEPAPFACIAGAAALAAIIGRRRRSGAKTFSAPV